MPDTAQLPITVDFGAQSQIIPVRKKRLQGKMGEEETLKKLRVKKILA